MTGYHSSALSNNGGDTFNLNQIFIGRQHQLDLFEIYLDRWKRLIFDAQPDDNLVTSPPSPNNQIQGLVVLLYGRGGFGKTTLLGHYRDLALQVGRNLTVSTVVDWEFAIGGKRSLFNPPQGQEINALEYFQVLCGQLAIVLDKKIDDFKNYRRAVREAEDAKKQAGQAIDSLQGDKRFAFLGRVAGPALQGLVKLTSLLNPPIGITLSVASSIINNEEFKKLLGEGVELTAEQWEQFYNKLQDKLGTKLKDYLDPTSKLGLSLGRDLYEFAKNFPLLIFFDTYEEADEGDPLLRIVMGAAGLRVGWIVAGRDNLWAGLQQYKRRIEMDYGYKEIVPADRGLAIDFNTGGVGAFTASDIKDYFDQLCEKVHYDPPLSKVTVEGIKRIWDVTKGVPLAVKIAAGLYIETANLDAITETVGRKREIVDQMVLRYLLHTRIDQNERAKLYGLSLLRRTDQPDAVAFAIGFFETDLAKSGYESELSRLHRRYSFIFTEKEEPSLHQEVRYFLRLWLLGHRKEPAIRAINEQLKDAHEAVLKKLEQQRIYSTLKARLKDDEWVGAYLDLTEQHFWLDPFEGIQYILPFMLAAAIYRREINDDAVEVGKFFEAEIKPPYIDQWKWVEQSLIYQTSHNPLREELQGLEELSHLQCPAFPHSCRIIKKNWKQP